MPPSCCHPEVRLVCVSVGKYVLDLPTIFCLSLGAQTPRPTQPTQAKPKMMTKTSRRGTSPRHSLQSEVNTLVGLSLLLIAALTPSSLSGPADGSQCPEQQAQQSFGGDFNARFQNLAFTARVSYDAESASDLLEAVDEELRRNKKKNKKAAAGEDDESASAAAD